MVLAVRNCDDAPSTVTLPVEPEFTPRMIWPNWLAAPPAMTLIVPLPSMPTWTPQVAFMNCDPAPWILRTPTPVAPSPRRVGPAQMF